MNTVPPHTPAATGVHVPLAGKVILVTGAGRGNGRALAFGLAAAGAHVIATDIDAAAARSTARGIRDAAGAAADPMRAGDGSHAALDITDADACDQLAAQVEREHGRLDGLVNNAGIIIREPHTSPAVRDNWRRQFDVNVHGTFHCTMAFLALLKASRGTIVNITSMAGDIAQLGSFGYSASKAALKMFTQTLAGEVAAEGVRVNAIAPGVIETDMTAATRASPERLGKLMARIPMGRLGQPEELVGAAVFLCSDASAYVTGATLAVDGGYLAV